MFCNSMKTIFLFLVFYTSYANDVDTGAKKAYDKTVVSPELKKTFGNIVSGVTKVWDGAGNMVKGMEQSFGYAAPTYRYSYRVFNDAPSSVFVATQNLTALLGANFRGKIVNTAVVGPNANTQEALYNQQLWITVWICADAKKEDLKKYSQTATDFLQKYGGYAGKLHVSGEGIYLYPPVIINTGADIIGTLGKDLGALVGAIVNVLKGALKEGLKIIKGITGKDLGIDKLTDPLEKYKILNRMIQPWPEKDDKIYFYRTYTYDGKVQAEYLDLAGTTSAFAGQFYNKSKEFIPLAFTKDGNPYIVTLERNTFNLLESSEDVDYSIRPKLGDPTRGFQFYNDTVSDQTKLAFIPISADGIGNVVSTQKDPTKLLKRADLVVVGPKLYTYEIYDTPEGPEVGVQGLKIGHFDQPTSGRVRDINPVVCKIWYKDAATVQKELQKEEKKKPDQKPDYNSIPFDIPEQVWINYQTADSVLQEKVPTSTVVDFYFLRPQIQEKEAWLYVVSLQTDDDTKAKKFLDRLSEGKIGQKAIFTDVTKEEIDKKTLLTIKPNPNGFINDNQGPYSSGVTGAVLLADCFAPQGVGSSGKFYYELDPGVLRIDQFANCIWFDKKFYKTDPKTGSPILDDTVMKELSEKLPSWIKQYKTDQDGAKAALKKYLQEKANTGLFVDATKPSDQREFTQQGKELYQTLIDGPISIKNYPIMRKAGMNWYTRTLGEKPDNWPEKS